MRYNLNRHTRSVTSQFRFGILPIRIETGRFKNIPKEERFCDNCQTEEEDEWHFAIVCPLYNNLRETLFEIAHSLDDNFVNLNSSGKLCFLTNEIWKDFSKFLVAAWEKRQSCLYNSIHLYV